MNETIGVKGGRNDRRRFLIIRESRKKKKNDEIKDLEKRVKKQQKFTLIKTIPFVIAGGSIKTFFDFITSRDKNELSYQDEVTVDGGRKVRVRVISPILKKGKKNKKEEKESPYKEVKQIQIPVKEESLKTDEVREKKSSEIEEEELSDQAKNTFQKLRAHKIVDSYEEKLKEIRYELRTLVSDYRVLAKEKEEVVFSEEAAVLLDKLSILISRIEVLKSKIQIQNLEQYDDNYIYTLIEDYLLEFDHGNAISELKDSPLYIMIAEKISELDTEKLRFYNDLSDKKKLLEEKEIHFEELKEQYYSIEKVNQQLLYFQNEQDYLLRDVQKKIDEAETVSEKTKVQVEALNLQSEKLLQLLAFQMFFPGPKGVKRFVSTTAAYLYFANQLLKPKKTTKKYRVIQVKDYTNDIENNMSLLDDATSLLEKTDYQVNQLITEIYESYRDYIDVLPECNHLLARLEQVKDDIAEKKYEMKRIKEEQIRLMDKNDEKVKRRGEYPM